jgi:predicted phosphohydrolase
MDTNNSEIIDCIYSHSKSLGEGTQTIIALQYLFNNNIKYNNFFKLSGRYWLSDNFNYENFNNQDIVINYIHQDRNNCLTALYKLPNKEIVYDFLNFLISNIPAMKQCIGYEVLVSYFLIIIHIKQFIP